MYTGIIESYGRLPLVTPPEGYASTVEPVFGAGHPDVIKWTRFFETRARAPGIFERFADACPRSEVRAEVIGSLWYRFSSFMPWFLCQAAAMVSCNLKRHYVIQTAFEELGMRDARDIHPEMFWDAARVAGLTPSIRDEVLADPGAAEVLETLGRTLRAYTSDEQVLGILLGLEIPAVENIETVFESLAHSDALAASLASHRFFTLHRQIEIEHVRLTVTNFLRFCDDDAKRARFVSGFTDGVDFWCAFWSSASALARRRSGKGDFA